MATRAGRNASPGTTPAAPATTTPDPGYAADEMGVKPGQPTPAQATPAERAASKPSAAPEEVPLPPAPASDDPGVNPKPGSGG